MFRVPLFAILGVGLVTACAGAISSPAAVEPTPAPSVLASVEASLAPTPVPSEAAEPAHPLIGEWMGEHRCEHIVEALTAAGFETTILDNIVGNGLLPGVSSVDQVADPTDPCAGAIVVPHSHAFTADGQFASYDGSHQRVDNGLLTIVDEDTFFIDRVSFTYEIDGDSLTLTPDESTQWSTMVALPGLVWRRVRAG